MGQWVCEDRNATRYWSSQAGSDQTVRNVSCAVIFEMPYQDAIAYPALWRVGSPMG